MAAPPIEQRMLRSDGYPPGEGLDRLPELTGAGLRNAEPDDQIDVLRIDGERTLCTRDRAGVALRAILDACGRSVLPRSDRLAGGGCRRGDLDPEEQCRSAHAQASYLLDTATPTRESAVP